MAEVTQGVIEMLGGMADESRMDRLSAPAKSALEAHRAGRHDTSLRILNHEIAPHDKQHTEAGLKQRFGERNSKGKKDVPTKGLDADRYKKSMEVANNVRSYLETGSTAGMDKLLSDFVLNRSNLLSSAIESAIDPASVTKDADRQKLVKQFVEQMGKSDRFRELVYAEYSNQLDPSAKIDGEDRVRALRQEVATVEAQLSGVYDRQLIITANKAISDAGEARARAPGAADYDRQSKIIERYSADEYQDDELKVKNYALKKDADDARIKALEEEQAKILQDTTQNKGGTGTNQKRPGLQPDEATELANLKKTKNEAMEAQARIDAIKEAESKKSEILNTNPELQQAMLAQQQAQEHIKDLQDRLGGAHEVTAEQRVALQAQLEDMRANLADAEYAYDMAKGEAARKILDIPRNAAATYLNELVQDMQSKYVERAMAVETAEEQVFEMAKDKLTRIWKTSEKTGVRTLRREKDDKGRKLDRKRLTVWKADRVMAENTINKYLDGGPNQLAKHMFDQVTMPSATDPGKFTINEKVLLNKGFTAAEINAFKSKMGADDKGEFTEDRGAAFFRENSQEFATRAVSDYLGSGGKFTRDVLRVFSETDMGTEMIAHALDANQDTKDKINALAGRDVTGSADTMKSWMKEHKKGMGAIALILLLLGGFGAVAVKTGMAAGALR